MVGPRSISPWGDRAWRVAFTAQLVVGGSSAYWIVTATEPASHPSRPNEISIAAPTAENVLDSVILLLAAHAGGDDVERCLVESHNIEVSDQVRVIAPFWDLAPEVTAFLSSRLTPAIRLGVTFLDQPELFTPEVVDGLRSLGFDVDVFGLCELSA
jgi:hypothetical protein